jgi:hypothetical protein
LHIAGLAQEALVLFEIQSAQFKVPTTGKAKKEPVRLLFAHMIHFGQSS